MQIQVNTDHNVESRDELISRVETQIRDSLGRFDRQVTRVEVHLNDTNANKAGDHDKRCMMEARVAGHQPIAVTELSGSLEQAITGAAKKLRRSLDHVLGRIGDQHGRDSIRTEQAPDAVDVGSEENVVR